MPGAVRGDRLARGAAAARLELAGVAGVASVVLVGDAVHLFVDDAAAPDAGIRARLASADIPFDEIAAVAPTIEDLFVAAVREDSARRGADGHA